MKHRYLLTTGHIVTFDTVVLFDNDRISVKQDGWITTDIESAFLGVRVIGCRLDKDNIIAEWQCK